jgi:hypothetical protein
MALLLVACGDDDGGVLEGAVAITAVDYAYEDVPDRIRAGSTIELVNDSQIEVHELVAVRLPDDEERPVSDIVELPPDELVSFFGGVETVVVAPPAEAGFAVEGTGELTEPGRYAFLCVIPTGADPREYLAAAAEAEGGPPEVAGGPPHVLQGMWAEVTVVS